MASDAKPTRVLIVEDETSFLEALRIGLGREGFAIDVARDGAEALERFEANEPDIILLDVMLPRISGVDELATIQAKFPGKRNPLMRCQSRQAMCELTQAVTRSSFETRWLRCRSKSLIC